MPVSRISTIQQIGKLTKDNPNTFNLCFHLQILNIVISGKTGCGKSFLACAFETTPVATDIQSSTTGCPNSCLKSRMQKMKTGIVDFEPVAEYKTLDIRRYRSLNHTLWRKAGTSLRLREQDNKASTILSGQIAHTHWYDLFPDPTLADAIMDRVIHNAYILALDSKKSMREVMAEKAIKDIKAEL
jgi:hypothetical protein